MKLQAEYRNGILELGDIFEGQGWVVRVDKFNVIALYEIPRLDEARFIQSFDSITAAIAEGLKLT